MILTTPVDNVIRIQLNSKIDLEIESSEEFLSLSTQNGKHYEFHIHVTKGCLIVNGFVLKDLIQKARLDADINKRTGH
jgi:uncharacterized protein (DUF2147 family)